MKTMYETESVTIITSGNGYYVVVDKVSLKRLMFSKDLEKAIESYKNL